MDNQKKSGKIPKTSRSNLWKDLKEIIRKSERNARRIEGSNLKELNGIVPRNIPRNIPSSRKNNVRCIPVKAARGIHGRIPLAVSEEN